jgi:hypothetical protein
VLEHGYGIGNVQQVLGHRDGPTTRLHKYVLQRGEFGVRSPLTGSGVLWDVCG